MAATSDKDRLNDLEARIAAAKAPEKPAAHDGEHYSQAQLAWRMVIELVAGLLIGFGMGYGLDTLFGTIPIFLVIFTFLGLAAGVQTMMRTAKEVQAGKTNAASGRPGEESDGE
ncbi:MAG: AtpZ/AtpI family protein [Pseudomonadota bacterium]